MQSGLEPGAVEEAPLYIRWNPERAAHAIELRLDLVPVIAEELARADKLSMEIGGVLVGLLPSAASPTLRIDDIEMVPRGLEEGTVYVLNPGQHDRIAEIRARAKARQREAVGFLRSHLRPGAMRPSLADRGLLSGEFRNGVYAVLLIEGREPREATFFLGANGQLPSEAAVKSFRFDEREFRALPEVQPEPAAARPEAPPAPQRQGSRAKAYGTVAALLLIAIAACASIWVFAGNSLPFARRFLKPAAGTNSIGLAVGQQKGLLRITWDHRARELDHASGATLLIVDGVSRREVQLGLDELRLGAVEYEARGSQVEVTLTVTAPGGDTDHQNPAKQSTANQSTANQPPANHTVHWGQQ